MERRSECDATHFPTRTQGDHVSRAITRCVLQQSSPRSADSQSVEQGTETQAGAMGRNCRADRCMIEGHGRRGTLGSSLERTCSCSRNSRDCML